MDLPTLLHNLPFPKDLLTLLHNLPFPMDLPSLLPFLPIPHVSSYSAPPSIPVVSYSQYISVSGSGPGVVCKNVTERRCSPKLKLERVPDQRLVMKDVLLDETDQLKGENKVFEPVEEDMVFNTTQAIPFPV